MARRRPAAHCCRGGRQRSRTAGETSPMMKQRGSSRSGAVVALALAAVSLVALPWYGVEGGLLTAVLSAGRAGSAAMQAIDGRWWLLPLAASPVAAALALRGLSARWITRAASAGLIWLALEALA